MLKLRFRLPGAIVRTVLIGSALVTNAPAYAQPSQVTGEPDATQESRTPHAPTTDFVANAHLGITAYRENTGGLLAGTDAIVRHDILAVGANLEVGGFVMHMSSVAALLGLAFRTDSGARFDLLATAGAHNYSHWGSALFSDDPGVSATLPYVGGLAQATYLFSPNRHGHFCLGVMGSLDTDLGRTRRQYSYTETGWLSGETSTAFADHTAGGTRYSIALSIGGATDLGWQ